MKERYKLIPEVFVVIVRDGEVLLGRRANTGYNDGNYGLPGGHGEDRETIREGAAREAKEELGLDLDPSELKLVLVQSRWCEDKDNPHARVGFYFEPARLPSEPRNMEPDKCDALKFFRSMHCRAISSHMYAPRSEPMLKKSLIMSLIGRHYD